jgi:hypothetical protein
VQTLLLDTEVLEQKQGERRKPMKMFEGLLGLRLIESLTESSDWESTWWDVVFRGLQEEFSSEQRSGTADLAPRSTLSYRAPGRK